MSLDRAAPADMEEVVMFKETHEDNDKFLSAGFHNYSSLHLLPRCPVRSCGTPTLHVSIMGLVKQNNCTGQVMHWLNVDTVGRARKTHSCIISFIFNVVSEPWCICSSETNTNKEYKLPLNQMNHLDYCLINTPHRIMMLHAVI